MVPRDVVELANPGTFLRDLQAGTADVDVGDACIVIPKLLGEEDRVVPCAAACNEYAKSVRETLPSGEAVVIQLGKAVVLGDDQSFGLVLRVTERERIVFVLCTHVGCVVGRRIARLAHGWLREWTGAG